VHKLSSLNQDHRMLLALSDALDVFAGALIRSDDVSPSDVGEFAHAFREFADYLHYEKEEHVLLPFLVRHGFDWNCELLEQIRAEHSRDRYLIDVLHQAGEQQGCLSQHDRRRLAATATTLASVQRGLTMKQDIELLPEVTTALEPKALDELNAELSRFDSQRGGRTVKLQGMIQGLTLRYCPTDADAPSAAS
jgi:hemerythrin-like domain-containing protein